MPIHHILRPYQTAVARAVMDSILHHRGLTFSVEMARQGGKNELSAQLEVLLLAMHAGQGGNLVKAAPTFVPQAQISMQRLQERLNDAGLRGFWHSYRGYALQLGKARVLFFSADTSSNVVGHTAHILLEVDEAQDVPPEKFHKEFRPMGASTNVTTVLYGTPWDDTTLLHQVKEMNLEQERRDGIQRHFRYDWQEVARYNLSYSSYVEEERQRLGELHPLFQTQYCLNPLHGGGGFLSAAQRAQLQGNHPRCSRPAPGAIYVAGLDLAGALPQMDAVPLAQSKTGVGTAQDSTVLTIGELDYSSCNELQPLPQVRVVEHCRWTGRPHVELYPQILDLLRAVWGCRRVVVDATGLGEGIASFLERALGSHVVVPFRFSAQSKSRLGFDLLAAINAGRLKVYAPDASEECRGFWSQVERARAHFRPNQTMNFYVDPAQGHDDFLMSLALLVSASDYVPRRARGHGTRE